MGEFDGFSYSDACGGSGTFWWFWGLAAPGDSGELGDSCKFVVFGKFGNSVEF